MKKKNDLAKLHDHIINSEKKNFINLTSKKLRAQATYYPNLSSDYKHYEQWMTLPPLKNLYFSNWGRIKTKEANERMEGG